MPMYNYTYLITNVNTQMKYIGVRSCVCEIEEDPYMGSSKTLKNDISEYGEHNFIKEILCVFDTRKEALNNEIFWHNHFNVSQNTEYYNKAKQTSIGFDTTNVRSIYDKIVAIKRTKDVNGVDSYQKSVIKRDETMRTIDKETGLTGYQLSSLASTETCKRAVDCRERALKGTRTRKNTLLPNNKTIEETAIAKRNITMSKKNDNGDNKFELAALKANETKSKINPDSGLNTFQEQGKLKSGTNHFNFKGYYITPNGKFSSMKEAARSINVLSNGPIKQRCLSSESVVNIGHVYKDDTLTISDIGKTFSDLGYGFEEVS